MKERAWSERDRESEKERERERECERERKRERGRDRARERERGRKSETYDEVTPFPVFPSKRVTHTHTQAVHSKQVTKESNDRKIIYFLKLFLGRTRVRDAAEEEDGTRVLNAREVGRRRIV